MSAIDEQLTRFLTRYPNLKLAMLFGSQATGQASSSSDIDLGLLFDMPLSGSDKLGIIEAIGAEFGRPVDIKEVEGRGVVRGGATHYKPDNAFKRSSVKDIEVV